MVRRWTAAGLLAERSQALAPSISSSEWQQPLTRTERSVPRPPSPIANDAEGPTSPVSLSFVSKKTGSALE